MFFERCHYRIYLARGAILTIMLGFFSVANSQTPAANYVALIIGNAKYIDSPIRGPDNDAVDVSNLLAKAGFRISNRARMINLTKAEMDQEISKFLSDIDSDTVAVIYYSGHGVELSNKNYLAPIDADGSSLGQLIPLDYILKRLDQRDARTKVLILDACRNAPPSLRYGKSLGNGLAEIKNLGAGTTIVYAAEPGAVALTAPTGQRNSVFTASILAAATESATFDSVIGRAAQLTVQKSNNLQRPWLQGHIVLSIPLRKANSLDATEPKPRTDVKSLPASAAQDNCFALNDNIYCE